METTDGVAFNWTYQTVQVGVRHTNFTLTLGAGRGTSYTDGTAHHNGSGFSTYDRDNRKCAQRYKGGWWYNTCYTSNLNGINGIKDEQEIRWCIPPDG